MNLPELADEWETQAELCIATANSSRSLDVYVTEHACAKQLRWCAAQLRLVLGQPLPPDRTGRKLTIALQALTEIEDEPHVGFSPECARKALADIADVDL